MLWLPKRRPLALPSRFRQRGYLHVPSLNDYRWQLSSQAGVRPAAAYGTVVTPVNISKGTYVQVFSGAAVVNDVYFILINVNSNSVSASARDTLLDIGVDEAGGTSYTARIPDLLVSNASPYNVGSGGVWYAFPLFIPAGSSIAARAAVNNASVGTLRVLIYLYGQPRRPETTRFGRTVQAIGVVPVSVRGTLVTPGTTSDGAWTLLGATSQTLWWWQYGYGTNDTTMTAAGIHADLSAGSAGGQKMLLEDALICITSTEQANNAPLTAGCVANVAPSQNIYGRLQSSAAADSNVSMIAYGLGS